jgi:hypothetical protein
MSPPSADAFLSHPDAQARLATLAILYDRFAHALDPFSSERDEAERLFFENVADWYDTLPFFKGDYHTRFKGV